MLLAGLLVILIANHRTKIKGTQYVWAIMGIVFVITVFEYIEIWCDTYNKPLWILYAKSAITYSLYPLLMILELFLIAKIKHKLLMLIPYFIELPFLAADLFGTNFVYGYFENHSFRGGRLNFLPALVLSFYTVLLLVYSMKFIDQKEYPKAVIAVFVSVSSAATTLLEYNNIVTGRTAEIAALEILVYYFYLAAIYQGQVQSALHKREIELEKSKNKLEHAKNETLMAQIQPHFINNSLMALRSRSFDYPDIYESLTNFSRYLRSNFDALGDVSLLRFDQEMKNIKAYLALEQDNFGDRLQVEYDIECDDFYIPALSVQPLVENAVRHGVGTYDKGGVVRICTRRDNGKIIIEVIDDGSGRSSITENQKSRKGIGIENVRRRLHSMSKGELEMLTNENGTTARITIEENGGTNDNTVSR